MNILFSLKRPVDRLLETALVLLFFALFACVIIQVFTRYVLNDPAIFTEEASRFAIIWLSLLGTGQSPELKLFIGWFGPRGLASIVFAVMVLQHQPALTGQHPVIATVLCTIILSVILHGVSANPWVRP